MTHHFWLANRASFAQIWVFNNDVDVGGRTCLLALELMFCIIRQELEIVNPEPLPHCCNCTNVPIYQPTGIGCGCLMRLY